jgi:hypothetical protein
MPAGTGIFYLTIPVVIGADKPTGLVTLPLPSVEAYGHMTADFNLPVPVVTGTAEYRTAFADLSLPKYIVTATGLVGVLGSGVFVLPIPAINVVRGINGIGLIVLPIPRINEVGNWGAGSIVIPTPWPYGEGRGIPISKLYRGVVMNLSNQAITTYSNFPFNSISYFNGEFIGANDEGLYLLGGSLDKTMRINSKLKTGVLNLGDNFIKHIRNVWLTYRTDGHLALVVYVDEDADNPVEIQTEIVSAEIQEERLKIPRGLRGRYYTIELKNLSGADFDIDELSLVVESIRRKVR